MTQGGGRGPEGEAKEVASRGEGCGCAGFEVEDVEAADDLLGDECCVACSGLVVSVVEGEKGGGLGDVLACWEFAES